MINKHLNDITWADLELLKETGREEDDRIEYKAAFSGGPDYLAFGDKQRQEANVAIAKEVVAFLNGRGGDVLIGVKEASNSNSQIEDFPLIQKADEVASRLAASLAALIEPAQSLVNLKVVKQDLASSSGVIVIRAPSSMRAPHRVTRDKECYIRRGASSAPMRMDEIQDMVIKRDFQNGRREVLLESGFKNLRHGKIRSGTLPIPSAFFRFAFVPLSNVEIEINKNQFTELIYSAAKYEIGKEVMTDETSIKGGNFRPIVGGIEEYSFFKSDRAFQWCSQSIRRDAHFSFEFALNGIPIQGSEDGGRYIPPEWVVGYVMNCMKRMIDLYGMYPNILPGIFKFMIHSVGNIGIGSDRYFGRLITEFEDQLIDIPTIQVDDVDGIVNLSGLLAADMLAASGFAYHVPVKLAYPQ